MPASGEIEIAPRQSVTVEPVLGRELYGNPEHGLRPEPAILEEYERRLEVVVKRDDSRPVGSKVSRWRLLLEVNENALDRVGGLERTHGGHRRDHDVLVETSALEHPHQHVLVDAPCHDVGVQRIHVGVGFGVIAEQRFTTGRRELTAFGRHDPRAQKGRQLVTELISNGPKAQTEKVSKIGLEGESVPPYSVQSELVLEAAPHLLG